MATGQMLCIPRGRENHRGLKSVGRAGGGRLISARGKQAGRDLRVGGNEASETDGVGVGNQQTDKTH